MKLPTVSVIVPVYNVEPYIDKCLASLVAQTYPSVEIVVIDDGSQDHSGEICDRYAASYAQVHCLHQSNHGLSEARNRGLHLAKGDYLMFVDSDDYVEEQMIERMMEALLQHQADIAVCSYWLEYPFFTLRKTMAPYQVWGQKEALQLLLDNRQVENFVWGKLFRASLFEGILFPDCRFEDIYTVCKAFTKAQRVVTLSKRYYHYVQRKGSLTNVHGLFVKEAAFFDEMRSAFVYQEALLKKLYPDIDWDAHRNYYMSELMALSSLLFVQKMNAADYQLTMIDLTKEHWYKRLCYQLLFHAVQWRFGNKVDVVQKESFLSKITYI